MNNVMNMNNEFILAEYTFIERACIKKRFSYIIHIRTGLISWSLLPFKSSLQAGGFVISMNAKFYLEPNEPWHSMHGRVSCLVKVKTSQSSCETNASTL